MPRPFVAPVQGESLRALMHAQKERIADLEQQLEAAQGTGGRQQRCGEAAEEQQRRGGKASGDTSSSLATLLDASSDGEQLASASGGAIRPDSDKTAAGRCKDNWPEHRRVVGPGDGGDLECTRPDEAVPCPGPGPCPTSTAAADDPKAGCDMLGRRLPSRQSSSCSVGAVEM